MNIIQIDNTDIGEQMSAHPGWFFGKPFVDMIRCIHAEVPSIFDFTEYNGSIYDLPIGTAIQLQVPGQFTMHYVKQKDGSWNEVTIDYAVTSEDLLAYSYSLATIIYMPR